MLKYSRITVWKEISDPHLSETRPLWTEAEIRLAVASSFYIGFHDQTEHRTAKSHAAVLILIEESNSTV